MSDGEISGNTSSYGGGVYSSGTFTKSGGTIYGSNADPTSKNIVNDGDTYGHAVYTDPASKKRNTTAGTDIPLSSKTSGSTGGWE
ncbi:MAG: hypothetical protein LBD79_01750 [Treponema sp.]|jgi:hypothetical protein|nr:hypothetical protein [Treponema sp.]